ncbi:MAG: hypothetical protein ARM1_0145 [Candidatus Micrarchaeota archaeon]|nr:MAG: hypothetical protein ARM1_0145 [Candidatus Micrarchaeota archaeon]
MIREKRQYILVYCSKELSQEDISALSKSISCLVGIMAFKDSYINIQRVDKSYIIISARSKFIKSIILATSLIRKLNGNSIRLYTVYTSSIKSKAIKRIPKEST